MGVESDKKDFDLAYVLFDLILNVHSTIFQVCGTGLPVLNQLGYLAYVTQHITLWFSLKLGYSMSWYFDAFLHVGFM